MREATPRSTRRWVAPSLVLVTGALVVATASEDGPTLCPFALVTGVACPLCGMTRAAAHLIRGDLAEAAASHPLVFLVVASVLVYLAIALSGRRMRNPRWTGTLWLGGAAIVIVVWLIRLATGTLPPV